MRALGAFLVGVLLGMAAPGATGQEEFRVTKLADSVVCPEALTTKGSFGQAINGKSFQQDALTSFAGFQYVAFYDRQRHVCLARRELPSGPWMTIRFTDYDFKSNDAHNTISMGICPKDGTIHLAFDHHGHPLHYRVSKTWLANDADVSRWSPASFGPVRSELESGKPISITYPRFLVTPAGGLQFFYRRGGSGNGDRMLVDYDPDAGSWSGTRMIDSRQGSFVVATGASNSRCSYPNGYDYGPSGRLHVTWVWRESSQGANHDLMYAWSDDRGRHWRNNAGDLLAGPPRVDSPGITVVPIPMDLGLMNTHGQAIDSQGRVHTVMWHCTEDSLRVHGSSRGEHRWGVAAARQYHHYWRDDDARWHHTEIPGVSGSRPKLFVDPGDRLFLISTDRKLRSSSPSEGHLVIRAASPMKRWTDWTEIHVERGPFVNEMLGDCARWHDHSVLSIMVQNQPESAHEATPLRLLDFGIQ